MKEIFSNIIKNNEWTQHPCGPGSTLEYTVNLRNELPKILEKYNVKSMLDLPCGDYSWMSVTKLPDSIKYIGADIVEFLISENKKNYLDVDFRVLDITSDPLPDVDLLFCRDCLLHLNFYDINKALANIARSNVKFILMSSWHSNSRNSDNIVTGESRIINFFAPPYNFENPLDSIVDYIPGYPKRSMVLWAKSSIEKYMKQQLSLKILTILGTRPEIIRLSRIIPKLDQLCDHRILHTGQNYDPALNDIFFEELGIRKPDVILDTKGTTAEQLGKMFVGVEKYLQEFKPDKVLILGDTNSGLAAIICERLGVPVYHMEAGNRCYDLKVPEEKNRKIIDAVSTINLPYTELSRQNLLREGATNNKVFVTGNPIKEVIDFYETKINSSSILTTLNLEKNNYIIATAHRAENVDIDDRLINIFESFEEISKEYKIVFSCHPRTKQKLEKFNILIDNPNIIMTDPLGFFDFVNLEKNAYMAISDSGTVQEEMCLFGIPTITIRDTTERPETVWCGSNIVSGLKKENIISCYNSIRTINKTWDVPAEYNKNNVSSIVAQILLGN
jgi:UDP-N-acetylglucosamine 2-epimerase (non-hydrolysing)